MSADQHPFKAWLIEHHAGENTQLGDLAGDVRLDSNFPTEGSAQDLLGHLEETRGASTAFLNRFVEAWRLYLAPSAHPFVHWLRSDTQDNPVLATFANDCGDLLPATGGRKVLRAVLEADEGETDSWNLSCFEAAWQIFRLTCLTPGCNQVVGIQMSLCSVHIDTTELL
jgi:uncharacterized protein YozE (UPF0346 family)